MNIFAARAEDADNQTYLKLVEIYQNTRACIDGAREAAGGTRCLVKTPVADLRSVARRRSRTDTAANQ